jgi:hypothetical protein
MSPSGTLQDTYREFTSKPHVVGDPRIDEGPRRGSSGRPDGYAFCLGAVAFFFFILGFLAAILAS